MKRSEMTQEQKQRQNRSGAASRQRYESKSYSKFSLRIRKDGTDGMTLEQIRAAAEASGQSVNAWILDAIKDRL